LCGRDTYSIVRFVYFSCPIHVSSSELSLISGGSKLRGRPMHGVSCICIRRLSACLCEIDLVWSPSISHTTITSPLSRPPNPAHPRPASSAPGQLRPVISARAICAPSIAPRHLRPVICAQAKYAPSQLRPSHSRPKKMGNLNLQSDHYQIV
jgi:hypothetical protein